MQLPESLAIGQKGLADGRIEELERRMHKRSAVYRGPAYAYAGRLLRDTEPPVSRIAEMAGYRCIGSLSEMFRRHTGMKPTEYREFMMNRIFSPNPKAFAGNKQSVDEV